MARSKMARIPHHYLLLSFFFTPRVIWSFTSSYLAKITFLLMLSIFSCFEILSVAQYCSSFYQPRISPVHRLRLISKKKKERGKLIVMFSIMSRCGVWCVGQCQVVFRHRISIRCLLSVCYRKTVLSQAA